MSGGNGINNNIQGTPYTDINAVGGDSEQQEHSSTQVDNTRQQTSFGERNDGSRLRERRLSTSSEASRLSISSTASTVSSIHWDDSYGAEPIHAELAEDISDAYKISRENGFKMLNQEFQRLVDANNSDSGVKTKFLRFYKTFLEQVDSPIALKDGKDFLASLPRVRAQQSSCRSSRLC